MMILIQYLQIEGQSLFLQIVSENYLKIVTSGHKYKHTEEVVIVVNSTKTSVL